MRQIAHSNSLFLLRLATLEDCLASQGLKPGPVSFGTAFAGAGYEASAPFERARSGGPLLPVRKSIRFLLSFKRMPLSSAGLSLKRWIEAHTPSPEFDCRKRRQNPSRAVHLAIVCSSKNTAVWRNRQTRRQLENDLDCQHFQHCSGCHLETDPVNPPLLKQARRFFAAKGLQALPVTFGPVHEWRLRARLVVRGVPSKPIIGLYATGTHTAVNIPHCRYVSWLLLVEHGSSNLSK